MNSLAAFLLCAFSLSAADFTGVWVGQVPTRNGEVQDVAFQFIQHGNTLTGKLYGDYASNPIVSGKVAGDLISFVVVTEEQAGNQINESRIRFAGSLKDGELELFRERETSTNAGNGGGVQTRGGSTQILKVKRLVR